MIDVSTAIALVSDLFTPLEIETVPLRKAVGRVLAKDVSAKRDQPPFAASAMDGYAVIGAEVHVGAKFTVIGESAAGSRFSGRIDTGQAARIFTGAPVPPGADRVIIQEDISKDGDVITISPGHDTATYIRPAGNDFAAGYSIKAPKLLGPNDIALLAAMNLAEIPVRRRPIVALVANGDELVMPGEDPGPDQIIASNNFGLAALLEGYGARIRMLPIARDTEESLTLALRFCAGADLIVTIGGASVGDHDIVHDVARKMGLDTAFYTVAMRPGKPLMAGKMATVPMIGLPGNPVSSMVCGHIFLRPALNAMLGLGGQPLPRELAQLDADLGPNGGREHYMRASIGLDQGRLSVRPHARQDSALLAVLANSNALLVRPPHDGARKAGDFVDIIRF